MGRAISPAARSDSAQGRMPASGWVRDVVGRAGFVGRIFDQRPARLKHAVAGIISTYGWIGGLVVVTPWA